MREIRLARPGPRRPREWLTVTVPGYTLAPEARISEITREIGTAIGKAAALVEAPIRLTCGVGAEKGPEFLRQSRLMSMIWDGQARTKLVEEPGHDHFSILEGLKIPDSAIVIELLAD